MHRAYKFLVNEFDSKQNPLQGKEDMKKLYKICNNYLFILLFIYLLFIGYLKINSIKIFIYPSIKKKNYGFPNFEWYGNDFSNFTWESTGST